LWQLLAPERPRLAFIAVTALATTILNVLGPKVLGRGTDVIVQGVVRHHGTDFAKLHHILVEAVTLYVSAAVLGVLIAYTLAGVVQRLMYRLREQAEAKLNVLPLNYVDQQARGDLLSRVTNDLDNVAQSLQQTLSQMLTSVLLLVGVAIMMFTISPLLAAAVGGLRVASGAISVGDVQAFIQYSRTFSMPLTQLASMMNIFQSGIASLERVVELLDASEQSPDAASTAAPPVRGRVEFND